VHGVDAEAFAAGFSLAADQLGRLSLGRLLSPENQQLSVRMGSARPAEFP
jgi:hypothetical protein